MLVLVAVRVVAVDDGGSDGDELQDMFGKCDIAGYCDFGSSKLSVDALCEKTPRNGLRDDDVRSNGRWKFASVAPVIVRTQLEVPRSPSVDGYRLADDSGVEAVTYGMGPLPPVAADMPC